MTISDISQITISQLFCILANLHSKSFSWFLFNTTWKGVPFTVPFEKYRLFVLHKKDRCKCYDKQTLMFKIITVGIKK